MSRADLLRRLNAASEIVTAEFSNTRTDPTRFMKKNELDWIKRQMSERYGAGSDPAQPYIDYLDGCHPLLDHPLYQADSGADALRADMTEQQCFEIWQRICEQPWRTNFNRRLVS